MAIEFYPKRVRNINRGTVTLAWLPVPSDPEALSDGPDSIEVSVADQTRQLQTDLVQIALVFTAEQTERQRLGHDAGAFALACSTGERFTDRLFGGLTGTRVGFGPMLPRNSDNPLEEPKLSAGSTGYLTGSVPSDDDFPRLRPHLFVRADTDDGGIDGDEPLYLSKIGRIGPVILSSYDSLGELYPSRTAGAVQHFWAETLTPVEQPGS